MDTLESPAISPFEQAFINTYVSNGFNQVQAYLKLRPETSYPVAANKSTLMMNKGEVQTYLKGRIEEGRDDGFAKKTSIMKRMKDISDKAYDKDKLQTSLNGIVEIAKIEGHYRESESDMTQYATLINQLTVNISTEKQEPEPIDITPVEIEEITE